MLSAKGHSAEINKYRALFGVEGSGSIRAQMRAPVERTVGIGDEVAWPGVRL
jgi:hypothetical protein